jgi:putative transposase
MVKVIYRELTGPYGKAGTLDSIMHKHLSFRWDSKDEWCFVTIVTLKRHPYFESEEACRILLEACRSVWRIHPFRLGALVIMPDHWHAIIKPLKKEVMESVVGSIKQRVFHASREYSGYAIHWQPRSMDHRIRDEADYFRHLEYMRLNPYKHELVINEEESWQWWFMHPSPFA